MSEENLKKADYKIIKSCDTKTLENLVIGYLDKGYVLVGGVSSAPIKIMQYNEKLEYSQAVQKL